MGSIHMDENKQKTNNLLNEINCLHHQPYLMLKKVGCQSLSRSRARFNFGFYRPTLKVKTTDQRELMRTFEKKQNE